MTASRRRHMSLGTGFLAGRGRIGMRLRELVLISSLLVSASSSFAQTPSTQPLPDPPTREPVFARFPARFKALGGPGPYYPDRAARSGISGVAVIQCALSADGALDNCSVVSETPKGVGFGEVALLMARRRAMGAQPRVLNGQTIDGEVVRVRLRFDAPPRGRRGS